MHRLFFALFTCMCTSSVLFRCTDGYIRHLVFENTNEWDIHHSSVEWKNDTCDNGASKSLEIQSGTINKDVATHTLPFPHKIKSFSFFYYEWSSSNGGGIRLVNEDDELELGFGTNNPQFMVDDGSGLDWKTGSNIDYKQWLRIKVDINWGASTFTATLIRVDDSHVIEQYGGALKGPQKPIKKLAWADLVSNEWYRDWNIYMRICSVRYEISCSSGQEFDEQQDTCANCRKGTFSSYGEQCPREKQWQRINQRKRLYGVRRRKIWPWRKCLQRLSCGKE
eukprot:gb/GECG01014172.1/.p1 GENE.gb/GECG01014172.1/~~gb/GECG01014172.1/.p1  ORF type:complete len:280 (+),score=30.70 gb/GECG01014172.1/:1-840(+)